MPMLAVRLTGRFGAPRGERARLPCFRGGRKRRRPEAGARAVDHGEAVRPGSREIASLSARLTRGRSAAATINAKPRQFYYHCHGKRAGWGASVRRSQAAENQYPQPTRRSSSGLQAVGESEACIPEIQECGAPDRSRLQRNANSHAHGHDHSCPSAPAMQHCGGADRGRPPPLATNS